MAGWPNADPALLKLKGPPELPPAWPNEKLDEGAAAGAPKAKHKHTGLKLNRNCAFENPSTNHLGLVGPVHRMKNRHLLLELL